MVVPLEFDSVRSTYPLALQNRHLYRLATRQHPRRAAVIVNPTKFGDPVDLIRFRVQVDEEFRRYGWIPPLSVSMAAKTRGRQEARRAALYGVDFVFSAGVEGRSAQSPRNWWGRACRWGCCRLVPETYWPATLESHNDVRAAVRMVCEG